MKKSKKSEKTPPPAKRTKEEKLFENLIKVVQQFMLGKSYNGLTAQELSARLSLPEQHNEIFHKVLNALIKQKVVEVVNGRYRLIKSNEDVVTGIMRMHPRGFGFLQPHDPVKYPQDIFVPKHLTQNAVDGDVVEVMINQEAISDKGPEGKVIAILERGRTHIAGIIKAIDREGAIYAYVPLLGTQQRVVVQPSSDFTLRVGDRVVMEVKEWGAKDTETTCHVSHYIGHISDPSVDIKAAIEEFELRSDFSHAVILEAKTLGKSVSQKEIKQREDLRHLECFTIDPDTAKDFDDAINVSKDTNGHYHLGVHIADVSHYVTEGSALDKEAYDRCNSTYFPGVCIPMLPHELSNELCSLKPKVNRLTASVLMEFNPEGTLVNYRITRSVIKSRNRFTYKEAKKVLDGTKKSVYKDALLLMVELCRLLKKKRYNRGSLEFEMPELVVVVNEQGVAQGTDYIQYDITHQLVEEFMLKANEVVATHLAENGKSLTYRIHDEPAEENMKDFSILAGAFGFELSEIPTPRELQLLFEEAKKTPYAEYLATSYIRRMRLAIYSADNIGHYGLGLTHYCHFTSPIRRYVDLVVHRILFGGETSQEALEMISERCSDQERISAKAEGSVVLLKKLRLLDAYHQKEPLKQYEAVVTKVKNFGIHFEVLDLMLESFLHVSELESDYYVYEDAKSLLRGRHSGQTFCSGDKITVMLKDVDFITQESSWALVAAERKTAERVRLSNESPSKGSNSKRGREKPSLKSRNKGHRKGPTSAKPKTRVRKKKK